MTTNRARILATSVAAIVAAACVTRGFSGSTLPKIDPVINTSVERGLKWLVSVQGKDGGWGQDGGETSYVRQGERLESKGNDVANTAVAAAALLHAGNSPTSGPYHESLQRAIRFLIAHVEQSPGEGLSVTDVNGTQIQRKLGPFIDTFLTSKLFAELDGNMGDEKSDARVRMALQKCVLKIEKNQLKDGSWNVAGGWAPILGTSMASRSLDMAQRKGVTVSQLAMARVDEYTKNSAADKPAASAGVSLYKGAQELEQLTRTGKDRERNKEQIKAITGKLSDARFVTGFGSMGGEEFFSYLNISDSMRRTGGQEWDKWNGDIKTKLVKLQNEDGTWSGHHCITGRVAVTGAAILTLTAERDLVFASNRGRK